MFTWYRNSSICYAYLSDVPWIKPSSTSDECFENLHESRWFRRGWTLQELIAPVGLTFYSADWRPMGTKLQLCNVVSKICGIATDALMGRPLKEFSVGERMS
jgi:hypothetical protein